MNKILKYIYVFKLLTILLKAIYYQSSKALRLEYVSQL